MTRLIKDKIRLIEALREGDNTKLNTLLKEINTYSNSIDIDAVTFFSNMYVQIDGDLQMDIKFSSCTFESLHFIKSKIGSISFEKCTIKDTLTFQDCSVIKNIYLNVTKSFNKLSVTSKDSSAFNISAKANSSIHVNSIIFDNVKINTYPSELTPIKELHLNKVTIAEESKSILSRITDKTLIQECNINGKATFNTNLTSPETPTTIRACTFQKAVEFTNCSFTQGFLIENCSFNEEIIFNKCTLEKKNVFNKCHFTTLRITGNINQFSELELADTTDKPIAEKIIIDLTSNASILRVKNSTIKNFYLHTTDGSTLGEFCIEHTKVLNEFTVNRIDVFGKLLFSKSSFSTFMIFQGNFRASAYFRENMFSVAPLFNKCTFPNSTSFHRSIFSDLRASSIGAYRSLKKHMGDIHNELEQAQFSAYEIKARREDLVPKEDWLEILVSDLYKHLNNHGLRIEKPIYWLVFFYFAFATIYYFFGMVHMNIYNKATEGLAHQLSLDHIRPAIFLSLLNFLGPLRSLWPKDLFIMSGFLSHLASFLHILLSSVLWFFLVLGVRKRFKV